MIRMTDVHKVYRTGLIETVALAGLTVEIGRGEFVAVMGPSGSGKTTFLHVAGLLDDFDGGEYELDGRRTADLGDDEVARLRNEKIGFVFESFNLIADLDVFDNVELPLRYRGMRAAERRERVERQLARVGLTARMSHLPSQLSGGQQQRVAIARALAGAPELVLADEPTGNLDSATAREIVDLLEQIHAAGTTVVLVTHDQELAARVPRRIDVLDGRAIDPQGAGGDPSRSLKLRAIRGGEAP